jgi:hypothetical protein
VLYEGSATGTAHTGQSVWFSDTCGNQPFAVAGEATKAGDTDVIVLTGRRPKFSGDCAAPEMREERLVFSFLRKAGDPGPAPADTGPVAGGAPGGAPDGAGTGSGGFDLPAPSSTGSRLRLWSTQYYLQEGPHWTGADPVAFRNRGDDSFGAAFVRRTYCGAAVEGSASVSFPGGKSRGFNFAGTVSSARTSCSDWFRGGIASGASRVYWAELPPDAPYGLGNHHMTRLVPFRSIAADQANSPLKRGTVIYIPSLRGLTFTLHGRQVTHDGYLYVADVGSAIKGSHIDFFTGGVTKNPFPSLIRSSPGGTFDAFLIHDPEVKRELHALHQR